MCMRVYTFARRCVPLEYNPLIIVTVRYRVCVCVCLYMEAYYTGRYIIYISYIVLYVITWR